MHAAEPLSHFVDDYLGYLYEACPTNATLDDLRAFLPSDLPPFFTNRELARTLGINYRRANSMTYVMRQIGILNIAGKRGRSILYEIAPNPSP